MMKSFVGRKFFAFVVVFVFVLTVFPMVSTSVSMNVFSSNGVSSVFLDDSAVFSGDVKVVENEDGSVYIVRKGMVDGHRFSFVDVVDDTSVGVCGNPPGTNLLPNPSFEEPGDIVYGIRCPKHWYISIEPRFWGNGTPLWDSDDVHSGSYSIGMNGFTDEGCCRWTLNNLVYVEPSEHFYNLAFWYKCKKNKEIVNFGGTVSLLFYDEYDNIIFSSIFPTGIHVFDSQWHYTEVNLSKDEDIFPPNARSVRFDILMGYGHEWFYYPENEVRFDDVFFGPSDTIVNNPPDDPVLSGNNEYKVGVPYRLKVKVSDPDVGDKLFLRVNWGENIQDPMDSEEYGPFDNDKTVSVFHIYEQDRPWYTISVQVFDDKGGVSDWVEKTIKLKKARSFVFPGVFEVLKHFIRFLSLTNSF